MKVVLDLPDWVEGTYLYVMAGIELVAYRYLDGVWHTKQVRCNLCGKCCEGFREDSRWETTEDGACVYLVTYGDTKECSLGVGRPWRCCVSRADDKEYCSVIYD